MRWWKGAVECAGALNKGAAWVWDKTPIAKTLGYVANTTFYVMEQGLALRSAIPAVKTQSVMNVVKGMGHILFYDILPVAALHYANTTIQDYFRDGYNEEQASILAPYSLFLGSLSLVHYGVQAYTWKKTVTLVAHTLVIDALGPSSFNEYKAKLPKPPDTLCIEEECNFKRKFKGSLREPFALFMNDAALGLIQKLPYGGGYLSYILGIYFYGEYIARMATPERCDLHKSLKSESVLSLGLIYTLTSALMEKALESTLGMPPYFYLRTLRHLFLLMHIDVASHMPLPLVRPQNGSSPLDPLYLYDRFRRLSINVVFAGLMNRIPIEFKTPEGTEPYFSLPKILQFLTKVLNSDLEQEKSAQPGFFNKAYKSIFPDMFHNPRSAVNDPIIKLFWPKIREDLLYIVSIVQSTKPVKKFTDGPTPVAYVTKKALPKVLNFRYKLPEKLSEFLMKLSKMEEFWKFGMALELWLQRNNISSDILMIDMPDKDALPEDVQMLLLPDENKNKEPLPPAEDLVAPNTPKVAEAGQLLRKRERSSIEANRLFSNKERVHVPSGTNYNLNAGFS